MPSLPTSIPTGVPSGEPSSAPTFTPTAAPTTAPTSAPTTLPTSKPSSEPTLSVGSLWDGTLDNVCAKYTDDFSCATADDQAYQRIMDDKAQLVGECSDWEDWWEWNEINSRQRAGMLQLLRAREVDGSDLIEYNCTNVDKVRDILVGPVVGVDDDDFIVDGWAVECDDMFWVRQQCGNTTDYGRGLCVNESISNCGNCEDNPDIWLAPCQIDDSRRRLSSDTNSPGLTILAHSENLHTQVPTPVEDDAAAITGASLGGMFLFMCALFFGRRIFCPGARQELDENGDPVKSRKDLLAVDMDASNPM